MGNLMDWLTYAALIVLFLNLFLTAILVKKQNKGQFSLWVYLTHTLPKKLGLKRV